MDEDSVHCTCAYCTSPTIVEPDGCDVPFMIRTYGQVDVIAVVFCKESGGEMWVKFDTGVVAAFDRLMKIEHRVPWTVHTLDVATQTKRHMPLDHFLVNCLKTTRTNVGMGSVERLPEVFPTCKSPAMTPHHGRRVHSGDPEVYAILQDRFRKMFPEMSTEISDAVVCEDTPANEWLEQTLQRYLAMPACTRRGTITVEDVFTISYSTPTPRALIRFNHPLTGVAIDLNVDLAMLEQKLPDEWARHRASFRVNGEGQLVRVVRDV